jgi:hypothetical protein
LGSILNADNKINIEIAERIVKANKAYYANAKLIKSKFLNKNPKMKISDLRLHNIKHTHNVRSRIPEKCNVEIYKTL